MSIFTQTAAAAKSDRPRRVFGEGLTDPDSRPVVIRDPRPSNPKPTTPKPTPTPSAPKPQPAPAAVREAVWATALRSAMTGLGYDAGSIEAAAAWVGCRGTVDGVPVVAVAHWKALNDAMDSTAAKVENPAPGVGRIRAGCEPLSGRSADELAALDRRPARFEPSAEDARAAALLFAPPAAFRYEDAVSPADVDRMFSRDADEMLVIGAAG